MYNYCISEHNYKTELTNIIFTGTKRECSTEIESLLCYYIIKHEGFNKDYNIKPYLFEKGLSPDRTRSEDVSKYYIIKNLNKNNEYKIKSKNKIYWILGFIFGHYFELKNEVKYTINKIGDDNYYIENRDRSIFDQKEIYDKIMNELNSINTLNNLPIIEIDYDYKQI